MLTKLMKFLPLQIIVFVGRIAEKNFLLLRSSAFISYGIRLKSITKDLCMVKGYGKNIIIPKLTSSLFSKIFVYEAYNQGFGIKEGEIVIDVGAHVGVFTIKASEAVGEKGLVVAIEPDPNNLALLKKNIRINGCNNVIVIGKAAGSSKGKAKLYLHAISWGHSLYGKRPDFVEVEVDTLDNIASQLKLKKIGFIKINAEGAELEVLRGAEKIMDLPDVKLSIEADHRLPDGSPEHPKILSYLRSRKIEKVFLDQGRYGEFIYAKTQSAR